jgi:hypothetical protein
MRPPIANEDTAYALEAFVENVNEKLKEIRLAIERAVVDHADAIETRLGRRFKSVDPQDRWIEETLSILRTKLQGCEALYGIIPGGERPEE